jgi:hypothetical protein
MGAGTEVERIRRNGDKWERMQELGRFRYLGDHGGDGFVNLS